MADFIRIDLSDVEDLAKELGIAPKIVEREIRNTMQKSLDIIEPQAVGRTPVGATGQARQSIAQEVRGKPLRDLIGRVFMGVSYGLPLEHGRKPGRMPPTGPIELWVRRKLGVSGNEASSVAFLIARAIGRRGTKGAQMFEEAFDASERPVLNLWRGVPERIIRKI